MSIELSDNIMKDILLYPDVEDNKFNIKIAEKDEFHRTKKKDISFFLVIRLIVIILVRLMKVKMIKIY